MKTSILNLRNLAAGFALMLTSHFATAQVHFGVNGSRIISESSQWGGGVFVKTFFAEYVSIGAAVNVYPKRFKTEDIQIDKNTYRESSGNLFIPVTGMLDFYLTKTGFRPYIGSDIGAYFQSNFYRLDDDVNGNNLIDYRNSKTYFGVGPHVGATAEAGMLGFFVKLQYNYMFKADKQNNITVPGINAPITTNPAKSFTSLDLGIYFKIGRVQQ